MLHLDFLGVDLFGLFDADQSVFVSVQALEELSEGNPMYDHAAVEALQEVRRVVEGLGPPILFRKLYGVLNAIEMQIEDGSYRPAALLGLGEALRETAVHYGVDSAVQSRLEQEYVKFTQKVQKG
jgi:hypothetical protein